MSRRRTALVLASSTGLGLATAKCLYRDGHNVIMTSRSKEIYKAKQEIDQNRNDAEVFAMQSDVTQIEEIDNLITKSLNKFNNIDILFTNIAGPKPGTLMDLTLNDFKQAHNDLLIPVIYITQQLIPTMISNKWGRIIINSSITAKEPSDSLLLSNVYRASLSSYSKTISSYLAHHGITVNTVGPGAFKTNRATELMNELSNRQNRTIEDIEAEMAKKLPMKRYNNPLEFGNVVAFLASDAASAITGTFIPIDGGISHGVF